MKSTKLLSLSGLLALALAGCLGPPPTVAPGTVPTNTTLPSGYPAVSSPTAPSIAYPAAASPTAATIQATAVPSETAPVVPPTDTAIPDTPTPDVTATPGTVFMTYQDFEIVPAELTVKVGTKITFLIKSASGARHQPYSFDPPYNFDSPNNLGDGTSITFTFDKPGTITLLCGFHPASQMHSRLTIEP
jgi:plastocyanin